MTTKADITEFIDNQWEKGTDDENVKYWTEPFDSNWTATRLGLVQNWMTPEVAYILKKLVGPAIMVDRISENRSNSQ